MIQPSPLSARKEFVTELPYTLGLIEGSNFVPSFALPSVSVRLKHESSVEPGSVSSEQSPLDASHKALIIFLISLCEVPFEPDVKVTSAKSAFASSRSAPSKSTSS